MSTSPELLNPSTVGAYLADADVAHGPVSATTLNGGVSNVVIGVRVGSRELVVKQALEKLRVAADWQAPARRILAEAAALQVAHDVDPVSVPGVVHIDSDRMILVIERAPLGAHDWKSDLMAGSVDDTVAARVGSAISRLHAYTTAKRLPPELEDGEEVFESLRLDPYHEEVARVLPEVASDVREIADRIRGSRICLVHGDLSPKNILILPDGRQPWLIDFEVAQRGDPVFDVAFLLSHLWLKAVTRRDYASRYDAAADSFLASYGPVPDTEWLTRQMGALLLARVAGKSPIEYLDPAGQQRTLETGKLMVQGKLTSLEEVRTRRDK